MEAKQLYEIVKNVPREAWPTHLQMSDRLSERGTWTIHEEEWYITTNHAENAFVGSMLAWLAPYGVEIRRRTQQDGSTFYVVVPSGVWDDRIENPQLVAALAIAVQCVMRAKQD